jgi:dTDP-glucose pyrophosphorylase
MAGDSQYFPNTEYLFPKPLIELGQTTIIERVIENLLTASSDCLLIFVLRVNECRKFHLDNTLRIITNNRCKIVYIDSNTRGAACSALMAAPHIWNREPLLIANPDQLFDDPIRELIDSFALMDAGVVTFDSVHPRWSYARVNEQGFVLETAEKRPISRHAIAGLYYFQRGADFVNNTMSMIRKDSHVNGIFYLAPVLNEMILSGQTVGASKVTPSRYHTFYTPQKIKEFESRHSELTKKE